MVTVPGSSVEDIDADAAGGIDVPAFDTLAPGIACCCVVKGLTGHVEDVVQQRIRDGGGWIGVVAKAHDAEDFVEVAR